MIPGINTLVLTYNAESEKQPQHSDKLPHCQNHHNTVPLTL